jgi:hypothetical protein
MKAWIENDTADDIVVRVKIDLQNKVQSSNNVQKLMDLVSGVNNYSIYDSANQGIITKIIHREHLNLRRNAAGIVGQFQMDQDDIISAFWETVFKYLPKAETTGTVVNVRAVEGQDDITSRKTKCNPINYLRLMGTIGVRNTVNKAYRNNLYQVCDDCGIISGISSKESDTDTCPECSSDNTKKHWPDGNSKYGAAKFRICTDCQNTWERKFARTCYNCESTNVHLERKHNEDINNSIANSVPDDVEYFSGVEDKQTEALMPDIVMQLASYLPKDPQDPALVSKSQDIFKILTDKNRGKLVCDLCKSNAMTCLEKCGTSNCSHAKVINNKVSCGADYFSMAECINFSKKIADFHGCSASLTSRRIDKIRRYVIQYIKDNADTNDVCQELNEKLVKYAKVHQQL